MATTTLDSDSNIIDYPMGINDLGRPKFRDMSNIQTGVYNGAILDIIRLILLKKGTYPDQPDMGIDIRGRYRFSFETEIPALKSDITNQIIQYLPEVLPVEVDAKMTLNKDTLTNQIEISIVVNNTDYRLDYDISTNTLEGIQTR